MKINADTLIKVQILAALASIAFIVIQLYFLFKHEAKPATNTANL